MRRSKHGPALFELIGKDDFRSTPVGPSGPPGEADSQDRHGETAENAVTGRDAIHSARPGSPSGPGRARRGGLEASSWAPQDTGFEAEGEQPGDDQWSDEADGAANAAAAGSQGPWGAPSAAGRGSAERAVAERGLADRDSAGGDFDDERHSPAARAVEFDGARVRISLTSMTAAAVVCAALVLVAGSFLIGKSRGRQAGLAAGYEAGRTVDPAPANDLEAVRQQPPATYLIGGLLEQPADSAGAKSIDQPVATPRSRSRTSDDRRPSTDVASGAATVTQPATGAQAGSTTARVDGFTYVVVQEFPSGAGDDAATAQAYLADHGVDTVVVSLAAGRWQLMTTQGFDRKEPAQRKRSDQLLEKIRAIGAQYYASGGRYKLEGYLKTHKGS